MNDEQMLAISVANPTNRHICRNLDEKTLTLCMDILLELDCIDFKEINPDAEFDFSCLPIPYSELNKTHEKETRFSLEVKQEFDKLLTAINTAGTNKEYSYLLIGSKKDDMYSSFEFMKIGSSQSVEYDWKKIEETIKQMGEDVKICIFHTHPKPIEKEHKTLYNKYKDVLAKFGVKPDGLNLSISDIYANQYLDMLCQKFGKDHIVPESTVLMHDGTLISFSTKNGVSLTAECKLEPIKQNIESGENITL